MFPVILAAAHQLNRSSANPTSNSSPTPTTSSPSTSTSSTSSATMGLPTPNVMVASSASTSASAAAIWSLWNTTHHQYLASTSAASSSTSASSSSAWLQPHTSSAAANKQQYVKPEPLPTPQSAGCFASTAIARNSRSAPLCARTLDFSQPETRLRLSASAAQCAGDPLLICDAGTGAPLAASDQWLRHVRLADDVHSTNAVLERSDRQPGQVRVRCLRDLRAGEELLVWFGAELLAELGIRFLQPAQIRGQNEYVCTVCERRFEHPNPLKMHRATECGRGSVEELWRRMVQEQVEQDEQQQQQQQRVNNNGAPEAGGSSLSLPTFASGQLHQHLHQWLQGVAFQQQQYQHQQQQQQLFPLAGPSSSASHHQPQLMSHPLMMFQSLPSGLGRPSAFQALRPQNGGHCHDGSPVRSATAAAAAAAMMLMPNAYPQLHQPLYQPLYQPILPPPPFDLNNGAGLRLSPSHQLNAPAAAHEQQQHQQQQQQRNVVAAHQEEVARANAAAAAAAAAHLEQLVSNMGIRQPVNNNGNGGGNGGGPGAGPDAGAAAAAAAAPSGHLCLYCGKVYSRKYGLKIHIRTHTGFKPLKCPYCFRPFGDPSNLNKHVRLHVQGSTTYRCPMPECEKVLMRRRDLQRHMQTLHAIDVGGERSDEEYVGQDGDGGDCVAEPGAKRTRTESLASGRRSAGSAGSASGLVQG